MAAYTTPSKDITKETKEKPGDEGFSLREGMAEVRRDAGAIREDLGALKDDALAMTSHAAQGAAEAVRHGAQAAGDVARNVGDSMKDAHVAVRECIAARPTTCVLVALGLGLVAGRLLSRR